MSGEMRVSLVFLGVLATFYVALAAVGVPPLQISSHIANLATYLSAWIIISSVQALAGLYRARPDRPIQYLCDVEFGPDYRRRVRESLPLLVTSVLFMPGFSAMKSAIPLFHSFSWDQSFIEIDRALHGQDPWRLLQPVFGYPVVTSLLSVAYHLWILLIYAGTILFALYVRDRQLKVRFFAANFATWTINGVVLAIVFSSVGPCFVGPILGNHYYAEQMAYLYKANETFPIMALAVQEQLMSWHLHHSHSLGRGITAMPSMHVALTFLVFLATAKISRRFGILLFMFLVVIMIGSVHLAYHYAIDGYLSLLVTGAIWMICGWFFQRGTTEGQRDASR